jgi:hypothetical protein
VAEAPGAHKPASTCPRLLPAFLYVCRTRPVYVQSTWLKSRALLDKFPMRYGFVTDLLEEVSL